MRPESADGGRLCDSVTNVPRRGHAAVTSFPQTTFCASQPGETTMVRDEYVIDDVLPLAGSKVLRIVDGCNLLIHVWQGSLWITQEGDRRDIVLAAGESFRLDRNGVMLARAWGDTVLALA